MAGGEQSMSRPAMAANEPVAGAAQGDAGPADAVTSSDLLTLLAEYDGPPGQLAQQVLVHLCQMSRATAGALLVPASQTVTETDAAEAGVEVRVMCLWPALRGLHDRPAWLDGAAEGLRSMLQADGPVASVVIEPTSADGPAQSIVLTPLHADRIDPGVAAFVLPTCDAERVRQACRLFELFAGLMGLYDLRVALRRQQGSMQHIHQAMQVLAAMNRRTRLQPAAMELCNQIAALWNAERVGVGFLAGRYVKLKALCHTERFTRKMQVVQDVEAAMEECLDQDVEVIHPASAEASYISRAAAQLARRHASGCVCVLPLRRAGKPEAVLTLERAAEHPFQPDEIEQLRLTAELCTARLLDLYEHDRWFGARWASAAKRGAAHLVGPRHTWAKVGAIAAVVVLAFALFGKGTARTEATFNIEAVQRQVVSTPFASTLLSVRVEPGDRVAAGDVLATLDTTDLRLELAAARAELAAYEREAEMALREGRTAEHRIAQARADQTQAQIDLFEHHMNQATILAPIDGVVVEGDHRGQVNAPKETGDKLFEIAPLEALRARLLVSDARIADVRVNQTGRLASATYPGDYLRFEVERINPVAEVVDQRNVFAVQAKLLETRPWLRPGMEGVAKIDTGRQRYISIWTRDLVGWLRMKLWF